MPCLSTSSALLARWARRHSGVAARGYHNDGNEAEHSFSDFSVCSPFPFHSLPPRLLNFRRGSSLFLLRAPCMVCALPED